MFRIRLRLLAAAASATTTGTTSANKSSSGGHGNSSTAGTHSSSSSNSASSSSASAVKNKRKATITIQARRRGSGSNSNSGKSITTSATTATAGSNTASSRSRPSPKKVVIKAKTKQQPHPNSSSNTVIGASHAGSSSSSNTKTSSSAAAVTAVGTKRTSTSSTTANSNNSSAHTSTSGSGSGGNAGSRSASLSGSSGTGTGTTGKHSSTSSTGGGGGGGGKGVHQSNSATHSHHPATTSNNNNNNSGSTTISSGGGGGGGSSSSAAKKKSTRSLKRVIKKMKLKKKKGKSGTTTTTNTATAASSGALKFKNRRTAKIRSKAMRNARGGGGGVSRKSINTKSKSKSNGKAENKKQVTVSSSSSSNTAKVSPSKARTAAALSTTTTTTTSRKVPTTRNNKNNNNTRRVTRRSKAVGAGLKKKNGSHNNTTNTTGNNNSNSSSSHGNNNNNTNTNTTASVSNSSNSSHNSSSGGGGGNSSTSTHKESSSASTATHDAKGSGAATGGSTTPGNSAGERKDTTTTTIHPSEVSVLAPTLSTSEVIREVRPKKRLFLKKRRTRQWPGKRKKLHVCVLSSSYKGTDSETAAHDNYECSPGHYVKSKRYSFTSVDMHKNNSYRSVRELISSGKYDVFFNLCDGGRDEKRAGVDVVQALEEFNAAFTGTNSDSFEPNKIDMKLMVGNAGVKTPNFVLLHRPESLAKKCRHLRFPVIVKHMSGYASVGISKDSRCNNLQELKVKVKSFLKQYNHALVEEFIRGREGTVLTCGDSSSPHGVKVFRPLMFSFLSDADDFAYFDKKWTMECNDNAYRFLPTNDPSYAGIVEMARNAFKFIMSDVGYGRVDFRIDDKGDVYFLEINPNCGMWYNEKDGGDFADLMVQGDPTWDHERFVENACERALKVQAARRPWYCISHDSSGNFTTRASRTVPAGRSIFGDPQHPVPVIAKALYKLGGNIDGTNPSVGCVIQRGDGVHQAIAIRHSCEPNMHFLHGRTLTFEAKRQINNGEELTVDYATLRDDTMPRFACSCGTSNCRSIIFAMTPMPRTVDSKAMKKLLRDKKRVWNTEKENAEAEKMLKRRSSGGGAATSSSGTTSNGGNGNGGGGSHSGGNNSSSNH